MNQVDFIKRVKSEITMGGRIPDTVNTERLLTIIDNVELEFKENDDRMTMVHFLILKNELFKTPEFAAKRTIVLPDCVKAILGAWRSERQISYLSASLDRDFNEVGTVFNTMTNGSSLLQSIAASDYNSFVNQLRLETISFDYNEYNNKFYVRGGDPRQDVILETATYVNKEVLYSMKDFMDYVVGYCLQEFALVTSFTEVNLIGEYRIDISKLEKRGEKMVSKVEKVWSDQKNESDFIVEF